MQDVPGSPDFLSIEDTSEEAQDWQDLELHLEIHQSSPLPVFERSTIFSLPVQIKFANAWHVTNDDFTSRRFNFITNRFPILLKATALFCNYRIRRCIICISVQSSSMKTSFSPWRGFFRRKHRREHRWQLYLLNFNNNFAACALSCRDETQNQGF